MLTPTEKLLFALLVAICLTATYTTFQQMAKIITRGQGKLNFNDLPRRVITGVVALISQGRLIRHRRLTSLFHYGVAWGFIFYGLVNILDILEGLIPGFTFFPDNIIGQLYRLLADIFSVAVLVGVAYLLLRRFAFHDPVLGIRENVKLMPKARKGIPQDSLVVGLFILMHVGARFVGSSFLIAQHGADAWQPFANWLASAWSGLSPAALNFGWHASWWVAIGLVFMFLPYFPYTKHAHLFMGPFNFMTRPERNYLGQMFTLDFEDESIEQFGAATLFDLEQTQIVDAFACIMCNRCQEVCPAYNTGKELSPSALEINKRYYIKEHMTELANGAEPLPLLDFAISESAVWACTACGACIDACPVGNTPMLDIMDIRRNLVLMESSFPDELKGAFVGMERMGNPWQSTDSRMAWAEPLPFSVPTVEENPDFEYLLWVGCAGAFNPDAQKTVRAVATILHEAGVSFAVLGEMESCTGDSARRAGNEYLFYEMAMANIETLNAAGVDKKRIVTSCPHCFTTLGREYKELGGYYEVYHHTQLIADLVGKGKLKLNGNKLEKVTFHDPCYLGRHNGVVYDPRKALAEAGAHLLEMDRHGVNSFCCGAGGAQMWKEEEHGETAVNQVRFDEARRTGATTLAVACPFCAQMMTDANRHAGDPMTVKDVAQIVVEAMDVR
ncbi:MAG: 4Fe-4S dicluster domain-containing protein [Chloroflexi bacterium]|nr:MAG: 4Fe-4S dicluster domain-containing protein [Chloroflexota bacterium]